MVSSYTYAVNPISQRTSVTTAGTAFAGTQADWTWGYDALGQVTSADHAATNASDRAYQYDSIGNREKTATGTLTLPGTANWISNQLNQYTTADGVALPTTPAPAPFDLDGNLTAGPVPGANGNLPAVQAPANATEIQWDAENRLVSLKIGTTTYGYAYDHLSRLIFSSTGGTVTARYDYDAWNRIAEYSATTLQTIYTWGLDLSGTMQGAWGVGGLLATRISSGVLYFPTYDGNGNVSEYLANSGGAIVRFEYDPFGRLTRATGTPQSQAHFEFRFSTKPRDHATGLYYYGYRWYDPYTGRWINRDPIEEGGGVNLYGFVGNDGISDFDTLGWFPGSKGHGSITSPVGSFNTISRIIGEAGAKLNARYSDSVFRFGERRARGVNKNWNRLWELSSQIGHEERNLFVFTCKFGWVDHGHFINNALLAYSLGVKKAEELSYLNEGVQEFKSSDSAWTPEDLISNRLGREFARKIVLSEFNNEGRKNPEPNGLLPVRAPLKDFDFIGEWKIFLQRAGAVRWSGLVGQSTVEEILVLDYMSFQAKPVGFKSEGEARGYQRSGVAHRCLCSGDMPKFDFLVYK